MVTARDTGKKIPLAEAYTRSKKGSKKPVYYTSAEAYDWWNEWNGKCIELLTDIVLEDGMKFPAVARKKLIESGNIEHTYNAIELCVQEIQWALQTKTFRNEYGQWAYIFAIIDGHYNEAVKIDNAKKNQRKRAEFDIPIEDDYEMPNRSIKQRNLMRLIV